MTEFLFWGEQTIQINLKPGLCNANESL